MNILIILGHPDENSFNHAIANTCKDWLLSNGHNVILHDLHKEGFDPVIKTSEIPKNGTIDAEIAKHCEVLLHKYWSIPERQVETSVVLADENYFKSYK